MSDRGISYAIGEFKELMDARSGGSGFSFVDLAADRAGVRFAEKATTTAAGARQIQQLMAIEMKEELFFPNIKDLPEGITRAEFEQVYGDVGSDKYVNLVIEIDKCITRLPAYRGMPFSEEIEDEDCKIAEVVPEELKQLMDAREEAERERKEKARQSYSKRPAPRKKVTAVKPKPVKKTKKTEKKVVRENPVISRLERQLATLRQTFTEIHPDVVSLRKRLEKLRASETSKK